jgi:hypothetical protein
MEEVTADGAADYEPAMCAEMGQRVKRKLVSTQRFQTSWRHVFQKTSACNPPAHLCGVRRGSDRGQTGVKPRSDPRLTPLTDSRPPSLGFSTMHEFSRYYYGK